MSVTYSTQKGAVRTTALNARALATRSSPVKKKVFMLRRSEIVHDPLEKLPTGAESSGKGKRSSSKHS